MQKAHAVLGAAAVAASALAIGNASAAHATMPHIVGTEHSYIKGMPAVVKRGTTVNLTVWYRENSPDSVIPYDHFVFLSADLQRHSATRGVTVSLQDSVTGKWSVLRSGTGQNDGQYWPLAHPQVLHPGFFAHLNLRISFSKAAYVGHWQLSTMPIYAYTLLNSHGVGINDAFLKTIDQAVAFTVK
jgi:hypothetical protein